MIHPIAEKILDSFKKNWTELSWEQQRHFAYRATLLSSDPYWGNQLFGSLGHTSQELMLMRSMNQDKRKYYGQQHTRLLNPHKPNDGNKQQLYRNKPDLIFWGDYFNHSRYLYITNTTSVAYRLDDREVDRVESLAKDDDVFQVVPVWSIEAFTDLRWQMHIDKTS